MIIKLTSECYSDRIIRTNAGNKNTMIILIMILSFGLLAVPHSQKVQIENLQREITKFEEKLSVTEQALEVKKAETVFLQSVVKAHQNLVRDLKSERLGYFNRATSCEIAIRNITGEDYYGNY